MKPFQVGDMARVVKVSNAEYTDWIGREVMITGPLQMRYGSVAPQGVMAYEIERFYFAEPDCLEPIPRQIQGVGTWSDCVWQPEGLRS